MPSIPGMRMSITHQVGPQLAGEIDGALPVARVAHAEIALSLQLSLGHANDRIVFWMIMRVGMVFPLLGSAGGGIGSPGPIPRCARRMGHSCGARARRLCQGASVRPLAAV